MGRFVSYGGGVSASAYVGGMPESRDWKPGDDTYEPDIDITARIEAFATVDAGTYRPTKIGARSWIFKHSHVGHDALVGSDTEVSTGAVIGGSCVIGNQVKIGLNATILPYKVVGDGARIGAGAVVTRNVEPNTVVAGCPAKPLSS